MPNQVDFMNYGYIIINKENGKQKGSIITDKKAAKQKLTMLIKNNGEIYELLTISRD